ncbi:MAG: hypothetical protein MR601_05535 [Erysipelotrichaceae bacterium]|nr:hypothetical protein [Erysipelotrichaceae bacterium]
MNNIIDLLKNSKIYFYENRKQILESEQINKLINVIELLNKKRKIVYRGFSYENITNDFWRYIFVVGEKGHHFRNETYFHRERKGYFNYDNNHELSDNENNYENVKDILKNFLYKNSNERIGDRIPDDIIESIEKYRKNNNISKRKIYYMILSWLHNIGAKTGYKLDSPYVSTTQSLKTAIDFANDRHSKMKSEKRYVYVCFLGSENILDYFETSKLNKFLADIDINWYDNIHTEIMIKDAIFPQFLIGIFEIGESDSNFILNNHFLKLLSSNINVEKLAELIIKFGIPINQSEFDDNYKKLGYSMYVEVDANTRKIVKNGKEYVIGTINE